MYTCYRGRQVRLGSQQYVDPGSRICIVFAVCHSFSQGFVRRSVDCMVCFWRELGTPKLHCIEIQRRPALTACHAWLDFYEFADRMTNIKLLRQCVRNGLPSWCFVHAALFCGPDPIRWQRPRGRVDLVNLRIPDPTT